MGMAIPQGDINTNLITSTITSILTHTQHHNAGGERGQTETPKRERQSPTPLSL